MSDALKQELEAAQRELASLSYSVSHDLRAPIRTIDGFSQALLEDYGDKLDEQALEYLTRIRSAAVSMDSMIVALVDLARISREPMNIERVDVSEIAQSIASRLAEKEPSRSVTFAIQPGIVVEGDRRLLTIALERLIENAWKFTSRHASALIEVGRDERGVFVRDDGAGFDPAHAGKMFGAFQRLHSTDEFEGQGMGLAVVQRIVNRHRGRVSATGAVEKGATFHMELG